MPVQSSGGGRCDAFGCANCRPREDGEPVCKEHPVPTITEQNWMGWWKTVRWARGTHPTRQRYVRAGKVACSAWRKAVCAML